MTETEVKRLIVMRHAKSSHNDPGLSDHDRTLNARGERDTPDMASYLEQQGWCPQVVLCSSAVRVQQTARLLCEHWSNKQVELRTFSELYLAPPQAYVQLLNDDGLPSQVMVLGHNPGLESLVYMLSGEYEAFPTAAVATFEFRSSWSEFASSLSCDFLGLMRPKEI